MITTAALNKMVCEEFDGTASIEEWRKKRGLLNERYEPEYTDEDTVSWIKTSGWFDTYNDDLAYFCWKCGCNLNVVRDWVDGSETFTVSLPRTEEEYQDNLAEAKAWWEEVMTDN